MGGVSVEVGTNRRRTAGGMYKGSDERERERETESEDKQEQVTNSQKETK